VNRLNGDSLFAAMGRSNISFIALESGKKKRRPEGGADFS